MADDDAEKQGVERCFRDALESLALPADRQIERLRGACVACELYSEFDNWSTVYADRYFPEQMTPERRRYVDELIALLNDVAGSEEYACWNAEPIRVGRRWGAIRATAKEALSSFGWANGNPDDDRDV